MKILLLVALAVMLAGCEAKGGPHDVENDSTLQIVERDVPGYGHCTFAVYAGYQGGGVAVIGCKPSASEADAEV